MNDFLVSYLDTVDERLCMHPPKGGYRC
jgi:hypothetical protein